MKSFSYLVISDFQVLVFLYSSDGQKELTMLSHPSDLHGICFCLKNLGYKEMIPN